MGKRHHPMANDHDRMEIVLFAHGSRVGEANASVCELARTVEAAGPYRYVRAAFLKLAEPDLARAVREARAAGLRRVVIVPYFLTTSIYLRRDLPQLVAAARETSPGIGIEVGQPLEGHPLMPSLVCARAQEVVEDNKAPR